MFQYLKDHDKYLYHYTSAKKALEYILKDRTLMFNSLRNTNDPKESKDWKFDFHLVKGQLVTDDESNKIWRDVSSEIKTKCKVLCFSKDKIGLGEEFLNDIYLRGFAMPRMWAQYGDNRKGVCLIFNKKNITKLIVEQFGTNADIYGSNVEYRNVMLKGDIFNSPYTINYNFLKDVGLNEFVRSYVAEYNAELFFEKSLDWRDENEFRYLMHINIIYTMFTICKYARGYCFWY